MKEKRGYFESSKVADLFGLPVTVLAGNVIYNGLHWHNHIEIIWNLKGTTHLRADGMVYHLKPGEFIVLHSGISHEIFDGREGNLQIIASVERQAMGDMKKKRIACSYMKNRKDCVSEEERRQICEALYEMTALNLGKMSPERGMDSREWMLQNHPLNNEENWCRYHMYMYQLLMILMRHKKTDLEDKEKKFDDLNLCVVYIHEHLSENLSAKALANVLNVSESTIYRIFSEQMGIHLGEYVTVVRLNAACRFLTETPDKVINIAYACGFTGLSNFYRVFRLYLGMTPHEYRKTHQMMGSQLNLNEPDIMRLNHFQTFAEAGYTEKEMEDICKFR